MQGEEAKAEAEEGPDPAVLDGVGGLVRLTGIPLEALLRVGRGERLLAAAAFDKGKAAAAAAVMGGSPLPAGGKQKKRGRGSGEGEGEEEEEEEQPWPVVDWAAGGDGVWGPRLRTRRLGPADLEGVRCEIVLVGGLGLYLCSVLLCGWVSNFGCLGCAHHIIRPTTTTTPHSRFLIHSTQGEVKSQNDALDDRQAAWLHVLTAAGLEARVIHVQDPEPVR